MKSQWRDKEEGFTNGSKMECRQDQVDLINNAVFGHLADFDGHGFADIPLCPTKSDIEYRAKSY